MESVITSAKSYQIYNKINKNKMQHYSANCQPYNSKQKYKMIEQIFIYFFIMIFIIKNYMKEIQCTYIE